MQLQCRLAKQNPRVRARLNLQQGNYESVTNGEKETYAVFVDPEGNCKFGEDAGRILIVAGSIEMVDEAICKKARADGRCPKHDLSID